MLLTAVTVTGNLVLLSWGVQMDGGSRTLVHTPVSCRGLFCYTYVLLTGSGKM